MINIEAINVSKRVALSEDGEVFPMETFFDGDGEECEPEDAVLIVCGKGNRWFHVAPADYTEVSYH